MSARLTLELPNESVIEVEEADIAWRTEGYDDDPFYWLGFLAERMRHLLATADEDERVNA